MKKLHWETQQALTAPLYEGAEQFFARGDSGLGNAFSRNGRRVVCMDEGTAHLPGSKLCLAGLGVLTNLNLTRKARLRKVAELIAHSSGGNVEICSHDNCRAAKIAADLEGYPGTPEDFLKSWCNNLFEEVHYLKSSAEVSWRHLSVGDMARPKDFHPARVVWLNAVRNRRFNPAELKKAPLGFTIDYGLLNDPDYTLQIELKTAVEIAFSDKSGFGERFTRRYPFVIIIFAEDRPQLLAVQNEINKLLLDYRRPIIVDGLVVPEPQPVRRERHSTVESHLSASPA